MPTNTEIKRILKEPLYAPCGKRILLMKDIQKHIRECDKCKKKY